MASLSLSVSGTMNIGWRLHELSQGHGCNRAPDDFAYYAAHAERRIIEAAHAP